MSLHVVPVGDQIAHDANPECICGPDLQVTDDGGLWIHRSLDNREATEPKEIEMTHDVNTSRELHVGQKVTVSFEAEITEIPEAMDYSDTVTVRDADNRLLLVRVHARNVHPHGTRR